MKRYRVIPSLLLLNRGLVKTVKFKNPRYVGDPINTVKIFNEKEVDELIIMDIEATLKKRAPDIDYLKELAGESFIPLCYGGGIQDIHTIKNILRAGYEKVAINSYAIDHPDFIKLASETFGSSTIVVSMDVKKDIFGKYRIYSYTGKHKKSLDPVSFAVKAQENGAGEILLNAVHKDGTLSGYDLDIIQKIASEIDIPLIASGGASSMEDFKKAIVAGGASAVSAGSMFVFHGKHKAVLVNYPSQEELATYVFQ